MRTPFTARRRRPCAIGRVCPHGGTIRRGDRAIRVGHRDYIHAEDVDQFVPIFEEFARAAKEFGETLVATFQPVLEAVVEALAEFLPDPEDQDETQVPPTTTPEV